MESARSANWMANCSSANASKPEIGVVAGGVMRQLQRMRCFDRQRCTTEAVAGDLDVGSTVPEREVHACGGAPDVDGSSCVRWYVGDGELLCHGQVPGATGVDRADPDGERGAVEQPRCAACEEAANEFVDAVVGERCGNLGLGGGRSACNQCCQRVDRVHGGLVRLTARPERTRVGDVVQERHRCEVGRRVAERGGERREAVEEVLEQVGAAPQRGLRGNGARIVAANVGSGPAVHHRLVCHEVCDGPARARRHGRVEPGVTSRTVEHLARARTAPT